MGAATQPEYVRLPEFDRQSCDDHVPSDLFRTRRHRRKRAFFLGWFLFGVAAGALLLKMFEDLPLMAHLGSPQARLERFLRVSTETTVFQPDDLFASTPSPTSDKAWDELLGPTRGFVNIKNPQQDFDLPPGRPVPDDPNSAVYGISMFHQLHCLIMIREVYYGLLTGDYNATEYQLEMEGAPGHGGDHHEHAHDKTAKWFKIKHVKHCFDFLQQSIRCAGLMQVELPRGPDLNIFDGYGSPHVCKRWDDITNFMEVHRVTDE